MQRLQQHSMKILISAMVGIVIIGFLLAPLVSLLALLYHIKVYYDFPVEKTLCEMECYDNDDYFKLIYNNITSEKSYKTTIVKHSKRCHRDKEISCYIVIEPDSVYPYPNLFHAKCHNANICYSILGFSLLNIVIYGNFM